MDTPDPAITELFTRAYEEHTDALLRHCLKQGASRDDAEEYVQEAFLRTWEYLRTGRRVTYWKTFLYEIVDHVMVDASRRRKGPTLSLDLLKEQGFEPSHDEIALNQVRLEAKILLKLSDVEKEYKILVMRYIHGLPVRSIAAVTGQTSNSIAVRLHRAIKRLTRRVRSTPSPITARRDAGSPSQDAFIAALQSSPEPAR